MKQITVWTKQHCSVLEQLEKNASLTVEKCELRSFDGNPVIYMENSFTFNDAVIDQMIENELWTEGRLAVRLPERASAGRLDCHHDL